MRSPTWLAVRDWHPDLNGRVPSRNLPTALAVAVLIMLVAAAIVLFPHLLGDKPCMEWNGWRFEQIWPRPDWCVPPNLGE